MLCDTHIISELARPKPNAGVLAWSEQQTSIQMSSVTIEECSGLHYIATF